MSEGATLILTSLATSIPVSVNKTHPENDTYWNFSFKHTKLGAGLQFLLWDYMAKARVKGVFFTDTGIIIVSNIGIVSMNELISATKESLSYDNVSNHIVGLTINIISLNYELP